MQKKQKNPDCQFFKKVEEAHFGPILAPFGAKSSKHDLSLKNNLGQFKEIMML